MCKSNPFDSADALETILSSIINECFPLVTVKVKSTDNPWIGRGLKRRIRRKRTIYIKEGKSERCIRENKEVSEIIEAAKKIFFDKMKKKAFDAKY